ncbi:MAG: class I SAM-dependent methyltransferase [Rhodospirillales bacterium]|jgi:SAM-dependent methyltransferase|nr:class I SAM-dependent methyltransferase [Rhodospirillales bacterium]MDP6773125.1 class I SAM-dependent methyltransferase [Rhodospirillales bacterium]
MENPPPPPHPHRKASEASPWVRRFAPLVPLRGTVLDVACGSGRHSRLFLELGHGVTAIDRDTSGVAGLEDLPAAEIIEADLEDGAPWPLAGRLFAAVVVTNYLHRPLLPILRDTVQAGGVFIYETFARGNERFRRPRNPDHLLADGELLELVQGRLDVVAYEHGVTEVGGETAVVQRLAAVNALSAPGRGAEPEPRPLHPEPGTPPSPRSNGRG